MAKIKWHAPRGRYEIDRVEHVPVECPYFGTDGKRHGTVPGVRIEAYAGGALVLTARVAGAHPATLANYRETMARRVQDRGGSWLGRSHATENAKADARVARESDPAVTPSAADRKALRDAHYGHPAGYRRPSDY